MVIKKVTVKFDSCSECPVFRYTGCNVYQQSTEDGIPGACPIDESVMMNRFTDFRTPPRNNQEPQVAKQPPHYQAPPVITEALVDDQYMKRES